MHVEAYFRFLVQSITETSAQYNVFRNNCHSKLFAILAEKNTGVAYCIYPKRKPSIRNGNTV